MAFPSGGKDVTKTVYSTSFTAEVAWLNSRKQENLRNRVEISNTNNSNSK
jgi:hypothetical protein